MNIIKDVDMLSFIGKQQSQSILPASDFFDEAMDRIEQGVSVYGDPMPWSKTCDKFRWRESEVTIWGGYNGSGKSLVMGQQCLHFAAHGKKTVIASMEMPGAATIARMLRQATGREKPTRQEAMEVMQYTKDKIWIYDQVGSVNPDVILGMTHWASKKIGANHVMIDSLVKCGVADHDGQKVFVDALAWSAKEHKIHIHLVHHVRKPADDQHMPGKSDIKGAGEITDLADNVLIIGRNLVKEAQLREKQNFPLRDVKYNAADPDCYIRVVKQRHGEWEGHFNFWFDKTSQQWIPEHAMGPMPYPPLDAVTPTNEVPF